MYTTVCIFIGGGAGSLFRSAISTLFTQMNPASIPWATFAINTLGCLCIGLLLGYLERKPSTYLPPLLVTGFCGGFTTFSTFSNETLQLLKAGLYTHAVAYAIGSLLTGITCVAIGYMLSRS